MLIEINRDNVETGELVFTIKVSLPHAVPFSTNELEVLKKLQETKSGIILEKIKDQKLAENLEEAIDHVQNEILLRVKHSLKCGIDHQLRDRIHPICQEIYNWLFEAQTEQVKNWLFQVDGERIKYYFDNDKTIEKMTPQPSELDDDEDEE